MRISSDTQDSRRLPSQPPIAVLTTAGDGPGFDANHLAALHRGLLAILTVAILMLLPVIVWGGSSGQSWTESQTHLSPWPVSRPAAESLEPKGQRPAGDPEAMPSDPH